MIKLLFGTLIIFLVFGSFIGCGDEGSDPAIATPIGIAGAPQLLSTSILEDGFASSKIIRVFPNGKKDRIGHCLEGTQKWICHFDDEDDIPTKDRYIELEGTYIGTLNNGRKVLVGVSVVPQ